jgi:hypothetical protein
MAEDSETAHAQLKKRVLVSLKDQGLKVGRDGLIRTPSTDKNELRRIHERARAVRIDKARDGLVRHEDRLLGYFASGSEVDPPRVKPRLIEVQADSEEELLFRYARLQWSIPVSAGYGRRLRFLVMDDRNGKLIGIIGLGDPVAAVGPRDAWIGWSQEARRARLRNVIEAFVLGAVQPYSSLLCGKLVAMLAASNEVRKAFRRKYSKGRSMISGRPADGRLALLTTSSALGRSSIYSRLTFKKRLLFVPVGYTSGSGEFHLSDGVYGDLLALASEVRSPSAKHPKWGGGWRSRREVLRLALPRVGLPQDLLYHGVKRQIFVVPLAANARRFLQGAHSRVRHFDLPADELVDFFRERWMLPRAQRDDRFRDWDPTRLRMWTKESPSG